MPMPRWWTRINKRVFNPLELRRGVRPVLRHVGRVSGTVYRTPLGPERIPGGYAIFIVYGERTDWLRNVLAAGSAVLEVDGRDVAITNPRVLPVAAVAPLLEKGVRPPPAFFNITQCLVVEAVETSG